MRVVVLDDNRRVGEAVAGLLAEELGCEVLAVCDVSGLPDRFDGLVLDWSSVPDPAGLVSGLSEAGVTVVVMSGSPPPRWFDGRGTPWVMKGSLSGLDDLVEAFAGARPAASGVRPRWGRR